ncbi:hypothetical protein ACLIMP_22435 [Novosphingobium aerophilum]|uniref:hypothetical protein n=1 Tax=Novosphingobium aerophilum TaxID=2839843 RepID=UPI00163D5FD1
MKGRIVGMMLTLLVAGCDGLPRDPAKTLTRIEQTRIFDVGVVAGTPDEPATHRLISEVERRTQARGQMHEGPGDQLFGDLNAGKLDLVIGTFSKDSPWKTDVTFGPALQTLPGSEAPLELKTVMRNGENRWIMLVERSSRVVSAEGRAQ